MITVNDYIKLVLKKKKWTNVKFVEEINKIEARLGEKRTRVQNISNRVMADKVIVAKTLVIYEMALDLPFGTLVNMSKQPVSKSAIKEFESIVKKVRG